MNMAEHKRYFDYFGNAEDPPHVDVSVRLMLLLTFQISLIILNIGSILVILSSEILRRSPKYILIINLNIVCLVQALFLLSVFLLVHFYDYLIEDYCHIHYFGYLVGFMSVTLIGSFCAAINTEYILRIKSPITFEDTKQYFVLAIVIILCYFVNIVVLTPIFHIFVQKLLHVVSGKEMCSYMILNVRNHTILFASSAVPHYSWVILSAIAVIVLYVRYKLCRRITIPTDITMASVLALALCFIPVVVEMNCLGGTDWTCGISNNGYIIMRLIPISTGLFLPFIWLINPLYRHAARDFITCNCCKPSLGTSYELV